MSDYIGWEFLADSVEKSVNSGRATLRVGSQEVQANFERFSDAHAVFQLIEKAYQSGRQEGIATAQSLIDRAFESMGSGT